MQCPTLTSAVAALDDIDVPLLSYYVTDRQSADETVQRYLFFFKWQSFSHFFFAMTKNNLMQKAATRLVAAAFRIWYSNIGSILQMGNAASFRTIVNDYLFKDNGRVVWCKRDGVTAIGRRLKVELQLFVNYPTGDGRIIDAVNVFRQLVQVGVEVHRHGSGAIDGDAVGQSALVEEVESGFCDDMYPHLLCLVLTLEPIADGGSLDRGFVRHERHGALSLAHERDEGPMRLLGVNSRGEIGGLDVNDQRTAGRL